MISKINWTMDSCSEQAQQEVEPGNNSDDETLLTKSVHYIRLQTWIWLAFSSLLVVLSLNSWSSMENVSTAVNLVSLIVSSMSFAISSIMAALIALALIKEGKQSPCLLQLDIVLGGSYTEQYAIWACILLTFVIILLIPASTDPLVFINMDIHANLFHGSWISLGCSIRLLYLFLKHYKDVDITNKFRYGGARCVAWHILLSTSIAILVSSVYIFVACDCHRSVKNLEEMQKLKVLCRRTALSLGLGASYAFVTIMVLIEIKYVKEYSQDLLLEGEALFSITIFVSITIGLIYITSIGGPAKSINTLYVATWGTFLISGHLSLSSVVDLMKRNKKIRQSGRSHSSSYNRNEN